MNGVTTTYVGNYYEWSGSTSTMVKYYFAGSQRVAMRTGTAAPKWILSDHLGSTSVVTAFDGTTPVYQRYKPFGETRLTNPLGTKYTFTGQLSHTDDFGLLFFNARWVDPQLARFAQADSIVPDAYNPQDYDRYGYVRSNPLRYVDPSGHICLESTGGEICSEDIDSNGWWADTGEECRITPNQPMCYGVIDNNGADTVISNLDELLWDLIPSAFGIAGGFSGQNGVIIEPVVVPIEKSIVYNWRSGELSIFKSEGAGIYIGTPGILGGNGYLVMVEYYGVSDNSMIVGPSTSELYTGSIDALGKLGIVYGNGEAIQSGKQIPTKLLIDPISGRQIKYSIRGITLGGNLGANGVDIGYTFLAMYTVSIYNWVLQAK